MSRRIKSLAEMNLCRANYFLFDSFYAEIQDDLHFVMSKIEKKGISNFVSDSGQILNLEKELLNLRSNKIKRVFKGKFT